jgi:hypothetical protein
MALCQSEPGIQYRELISHNRSDDQTRALCPRVSVGREGGELWMCRNLYVENLTSGWASSGPESGRQVLALRP